MMFMTRISSLFCHRSRRFFGAGGSRCYTREYCRANKTWITTRGYRHGWRRQSRLTEVRPAYQRRKRKTQCPQNQSRPLVKIRQDQPHIGWEYSRLCFCELSPLLLLAGPIASTPGRQTTAFCRTRFGRSLSHESLLRKLRVDS